MLIFIISFIFIICSFILLFQVKKITIHKKIEEEKYIQKLQNEITQLLQEINNLNNVQLEKRKNIDNDLRQWKEAREKEIQADLQHQKELAQQNIIKFNQSAEQQIIEISQKIQTTQKEAQQKKEQLQKDIHELQASLNAGIQARLRKQELIEAVNFYKLSISEEDLTDIQMLENLKNSFHRPVVLSKLIWSQYFQKQMNELCDRILGKKNVCGIYKITNILTEQCYIGQSVNIKDRWKAHCKCGLGIEASSTNSLYQAMQKDKIWNFTFELLEECQQDQLNKKEVFWIDTYQSNKFGYNSNKGMIK